MQAQSEAHTYDDTFGYRGRKDAIDSMDREMRRMRILVPVGLGIALAGAILQFIAAVWL